MPDSRFVVNRYQRMLLVVAVIDVVVMLLFPPFQELPLAKAALPAFDGFHPLITRWGIKPVDTDLLTLQLIFVSINALAAFLCLQGDPGRNFHYGRGIGIFAAINFALILLFPPFEPYPGLFAPVGSSFDSFNFVFGSRVDRPIFVPLLYLECVFIAVNALSLWLLFNTARRGNDARRAKRDKLIELADVLDERQIDVLAEGLLSQTRPAPDAGGQMGRHRERRCVADPNYAGPERRKGTDRRRH